LWRCANTGDPHVAWRSRASTYFCATASRAQHCGEAFPASELTFEHVIPRSRGAPSVGAVRAWLADYAAPRRAATYFMGGSSDMQRLQSHEALWQLFTNNGARSGIIVDAIASPTP
jgi:hypothetical protein